MVDWQVERSSDNNYLIELAVWGSNKQNWNSLADCGRGHTNMCLLHIFLIMVSVFPPSIWLVHVQPQTKLENDLRQLDTGHENSLVRLQSKTTENWRARHFLDLIWKVVYLNKREKLLRIMNLTLFPTVHTTHSVFY